MLPDMGALALVLLLPFVWLLVASIEWVVYRASPDKANRLHIALFRERSGWRWALFRIAVVLAYFVAFAWWGDHIQGHHWF